MSPNAIKSGKTFSDGKDGVRYVYRLSDDTVFYEMLSGGMNRYTENLGVSANGFLKFKCSLKSFSAWAKKEVQVVVMDDPNTGMPLVSLEPEQYEEAMIRSIIDDIPLDVYVNAMLKALFATDSRPEVKWFPVFATTKTGHMRETHFGVAVEGVERPALCGIQSRRHDLLWDTAPERPMGEAADYLAANADSLPCEACKARLLIMAEAAAMPAFKG